MVVLAAKGRNPLTAATSSCKTQEAIDKSLEAEEMRYHLNNMRSSRKRHRAIFEPQLRLKAE